MEKRGLSHLEVIFSVIIFVSAVSVALFFFDPASSYNSGEPSYDYIAKAIEENLTINVTIYGVEEIKDNGKLNKITINKKLKEGAVQKLGIVIVNEKGEKIRDYDVVDEDLGTISWNSQKNFVYVIVGEDLLLTGSTIPGNPQDAKIASVSSVYTKKVISETRAKSLKANYVGNYYALKKFFGISDNINLGFELMGIKAERTPLPQQVSIISKTKRVEVLKENDNKFEFGTLRVKIW